MADWTVTVTNACRVFGMGPTSKWNDVSWNAFKWSEGTNEFIHTIGKYVSNDPGMTAAIARYDATHKVSRTFAVTMGMTDETLKDGRGWKYVFTSDTTNAEERDDADWSEVEDGTASWTSVTGGSTTWS